MKYLLIALIISININAAEMRHEQAPENQTVLQSFLSKESESSTTNAILSTVALFKQLVVHIPKSEYAFGLENGVGNKYPDLDKWIQWQITGQKDKLVDRHKLCLANKSKTSQRVRVTLEHIISSKMTNAMADIAQGSKEKAEQALKKMKAERELYELNDYMGLGSVPAIKTVELVAAERIYLGRFNIAAQNDMVITTQDMFYQTSKELFANLDESKFKSEDAYVAEVMKGIEWMKGVGMFNISDEQKVTNIKSIFKGIHYTSRRFQQRMKVGTGVKIMDSILNAVYPMWKGKSLKQNLYDAVYNKRPHLGYKLEILYRDDIGAFSDMATDILLMVKHEVTSKLKLGAAMVDLVGCFAEKLDASTETLYKERMNAQK